jgi:hypothetical protein
MKKIIIFIVSVILIANFCFAQAGIYSTIDPYGLSSDTHEESTLGEIVGDTIKNVSIIEYHGGWKDKSQAREDLLNVLRNKKIKVSSWFLWPMDMPVELVGVIEYSDGSQGKIGVVKQRVGFQDKIGRPWFFEWDDRIPWKSN